MSWLCHIAGCNNSIRRIENRISPYFILLFLMQFGLWRAAAFVSSPIHLFQLTLSDLAKYSMTKRRVVFLRELSFLLFLSSLCQIYTNYLTTELAHTVNWNMVYLAELLVVMTDRLKLSEFMLVHGHKRFWRQRVSLSLASGKRRCTVCSRCAGAPSCWKTKKLVLGQCACLAGL